MKTYKLLLFAVLITIASACRKDVPELYNPNEEKLLDTPSQVFTAFWHGMNNSYAFWDIDSTDWDKVYVDYLPRFKALDSQKEVSTSQLREMYYEMTKNLIDHHLSIEIKNTRALKNERDTIVLFPGYGEVSAREYYHTRMTREELKVPMDKNVRSGRISDLIGGEGYCPDFEEEMEAYSYNIDNGVAYIYLSDFFITGVAKSDKESPVIQVVANFLYMILEMPNLKGVIVDVRGNGGGYTNDMRYILAPMLGEKLLAGYTKSKNGPGRLDYTPWVPCVIPPGEEHRKIEVPIVAIADLYSVSMAEMISMAILELPNGYMVGERTWGGHGPLDGDYSATYGGKFKNSVMEITTSTSILKRVDGPILEGVGVTPDVEVLYNKQSMLNGVDLQLERALELIKEKSGAK